MNVSPLDVSHMRLFLLMFDKQWLEDTFSIDILRKVSGFIPVVVEERRAVVVVVVEERRVLDLFWAAVKKNPEEVK